jgi:hypothetical protein
MNLITLLGELIHKAFIQKLLTPHESYSKRMSSNKSRVYPILNLDLISFALAGSTHPTVMYKPCKKLCKTRLPSSCLMAKWIMSTIRVAKPGAHLYL